LLRLLRRDILMANSSSNPFIRTCFDSGHKTRHKRRRRFLLGLAEGPREQDGASPHT
jgi:hypothetical protein